MTELRRPAVPITGADSPPPPVTDAHFATDNTQVGSFTLGCGQLIREPCRAASEMLNPHFHPTRQKFSASVRAVRF